MRVYDTSPITDSAAMPVKKGTLDFLQKSYSEMLAELANDIFPGLNTANVNVLRGGAYLFFYGENSCIMQPGTILYNNEIFFTPGGTLNYRTAASLVISTAYYTGDGVDADPVTFTDTNPHNVHQIRTIVLADGNSTSLGANFVCELTSLVYNVKIGEIKMYCGISNAGTLVLEGFDDTGLGLPNSAWNGWALCNGGTFNLPFGGATTTINLCGQFVVGYDPTQTDYNALGNQAGLKMVTLTGEQSGIQEHTHGSGYPLLGAITGNDFASGSGTANLYIPFETSIDTTGPSDATACHENRPPYFTLAYVQRIF